MSRKGCKNGVFMVSRWVQNLTESVMGGAPFAIGDIVKRPSGRTVKITGGKYWGTYGFSNFWYWKKVLSGGELGKEESGYGWEQQDK